MPKLSVWLVRASLIHMGVGFLFGACILYQKGNPIYAWSWRLLNPHVEIVIVGWTMQFVMGIVYWILPRFSSEPRYGKTVLGWWSFVLLNSGVFVAAIGAWFAVNAVALVGRLFALSAVLLVCSTHLSAYQTGRQLPCFPAFMKLIPEEKQHDTT